MKDLIIAILLSVLPVSELRGGIPYAILNGVNPATAFIVCVFFNILIIPVIFFFLDYVHGFFMGARIYNKLFTRYLNHKIDRVKRKYETLSFFVLFLFVAVPFPGTGAYTGTLLSWFFKLNRKKSFWVIGVGVVVAGVITTLASLGIINLFGLI